MFVCSVEEAGSCLVQNLGKEVLCNDYRFSFSPFSPLLLLPPHTTILLLFCNSSLRFAEFGLKGVRM